MNHTTGVGFLVAGTVLYCLISRCRWNIDGISHFDDSYQVLMLLNEYSITHDTKLSTRLTIISGDISTSAPLILGGHSQNLSTSVLNGIMDDACVWNRALTQQEIQQYMICPPTGTELGLVGYWNFEEGQGTTTYDQSANGNNSTFYNSSNFFIVNSNISIK